MIGKRSFFALWFIVIIGGAKIDWWHESQFLPPPEERESAQVLTDVFGEVKSVLARYLWFKMDLFHEVLDEQGVDPNQQSEVLPLLRIVTLLEPSLTDSYDQLVWDLYRGHKKVETAMSVLEEGLKRNPESYQLTFRKALIQHMQKQHVESRITAEKALPLTKDKTQWADCLRLVYWSSVELEDLPVRKHALQALLKLRPDDPLWIRERKKMELEELETK